MHELQKALTDIATIRAQMAAGTQFQGFGPVVIAATGLIAIALAVAQTVWPMPGASDPAGFLGPWLAAAVVCAVLVGAEMIARTRRRHGGLADTMLLAAAQHFLPVGVAGAALTAVLLQMAPDTAWMLPGLWQVLVGIGLFAMVRFLPASVAIAAAWYLVAGIAGLMQASDARSLTPWMMGLPFGFGQLLLAGLIHFANESGHDEQT